MRVFTLLFVILISVVLIYRVCVISGIKLPKNKFITKYIIGSARGRYGGERVSKKDIVRVGLCALLFRLSIYFVSYLALVFIYAHDISNIDFLSWWNKWDAPKYLGIIEGGYTNLPLDGINGMGDGVYQTLVFLPLYPFLVWLLNFLINSPMLSAVIMSALCYVGGIIFLYMAAAFKYNKSIAEKAAVLISVFPFGFYFSCMLPESMVLLTASACIYFSFKKKWWIAGIFGMLCTLTKLQGITILAFMGIEWLESNEIFLLIRKKDWKAFFKNLISLIPMCFPFIGILIYLVINYYYTSDAFYFLKLQKYIWSHSFADCGICLNNILEQILKTPADIDAARNIIGMYIPEFLLFFLAIYVIYRSVNKNRSSLSVFLLFYTVLSYSADWVISGARYLSIAIPLFILSAELVEKRPVLYRFLVFFGLTLQVIFMYCHLSYTGIVV